MALAQDILACTHCADRFATTRTAHAPRPVVWFQPGARILIAGQAPGQRVHASGKPFDDPSGDRLRDWMGIGADSFYDRARVAILPMAFCFPGYDARGGRSATAAGLCPDLARRRSGRDGRGPADAAGGGLCATLSPRHAGRHRNGRGLARPCPRCFPLPHPSWRNTGWLKRNPWFAAELLPALRARVSEVLQ